MSTSPIVDVVTVEVVVVVVMVLLVVVVRSWQEQGSGPACDTRAQLPWPDDGPVCVWQFEHAPNAPCGGVSVTLPSPQMSTTTDPSAWVDQGSRFAAAAGVLASATTATVMAPTVDLCTARSRASRLTGIVAQVIERTNIGELPRLVGATYRGPTAAVNPSVKPCDAFGSNVRIAYADSASHLDTPALAGSVRWHPRLGHS
jgi:hypothetical protein